MRVSRKNKDKKTSYLMPSVFLCTAIFVILLTIGYSIITDTLTVNGKGVIRAKLDIRITNIELAGTTNGGLINSNPEFYATSPTTSRVLWDVNLPNAESTVTFNVTVTNLSELNAVVTNIRELNDSNPNIEYILGNMAINTVKMPATNNYQFQITVKYKDSVKPNISSINRNEIANIEFTFYKLPVYTYQITTNQQDAEIKVKIDNKDTQTYQGSYNASLDEGTNISFEIQKYGYQTITLNETVTTDIAHNYTMTELKKYTMTFTTNPTNAILNVTYGDRQIANTSSGSVTFEAYGGYTYNYVATGFEYYDSTGTYTMPASNSTYNITLTEWPGYSATFSNSNREKAVTGSVSAPRTGYYLIEIWGGHGGDQFDTGDNGGTGYGGENGYIYGVAKINYGQTMYYTVGGSGENARIAVKSIAGANGGGSADGLYPGSGGGYSAFAVDTTTINATTINSGNVLFIAGGGGGGSSNATAVATRHVGEGGAAGNMNSTKTTISTGTVFHGSNGTIGVGSTASYGLGGTTTGGASNSNNGNAGALLAGGNGLNKGGAGGAGYYGGSGGGGKGSSNDKNSGGGGGGSSFISNKVTFENLKTSATNAKINTNPSSTGGAIHIQFIGRDY